MLILVPVSIADAKSFVSLWHRHHAAPQGALFAVGCAVHGEETLRGVAIVGRPVARMLQDGWTCEVVRCATDGTRNACSFLYGASWRAAKALGYRRIVTYTLPEEGGASLRGAGWALSTDKNGTPLAVGGGSWSRKTRPRVDKAPMQRKLRWERV